LRGRLSRLDRRILRGYTEEPDACSAQRIENTKDARVLDASDMECLRILCELHLEQEDLDKGEHYHNRAFALNPNGPRLRGRHGELMVWLDRPDEAVWWVWEAMRLDPFGAACCRSGRATILLHTSGLPYGGQTAAGSKEEWPNTTSIRFSTNWLPP
jgi:hypothetical protein